jgi:lipopolysaccharide biosynthesis regulator YciM
MRSSNFFRSAALVLVVLLSLGSVNEALAQEKIGAKVGKPLKAAQEALQKKQWDQALAKITEADAVSGKSAFEQYQINEMKGYVLLQQRKYGEVAGVYEQNLKSGKMPAEQVNDRLKLLVQLYTATRNYPKVIENGDRWLKAGGKDIDTQVLVGQAYYLQKDYKNAVTSLQNTIRTAEQAGKPVEENWLQIVRSAQQNLGDNAGATETMEKMVRLFPKTEYWDFLISTRLREKGSDRVTLNLLRLARQVGVLDTPEEYTELAEMLLEDGLPGEAKAVMEAGYQAKVFETTDKARADRYARRLNEAKTSASKDLASLPATERDAAKVPTGQGDVALGMAYSSFGQYDKAAAALARGIEKGGVRDPDQANMMLGITQVKLGNRDAALKAFEQVSADPQMAEVARLWKIAARTNSG